MTRTTTLGELISTMYEEFLDLYGDGELASVATAAVINDLLASAEREEVSQSGEGPTTGWQMATGVA